MADDKTPHMMAMQQLAGGKMRMTDTPYDTAMALSKQELARQLVEAQARIEVSEAALREIITTLDFANGGKLVEAAAEKANGIARAALAPEQDK